VKSIARLFNFGLPFHYTIDNPGKIRLGNELRHIYTKVKNKTQISEKNSDPRPVKKSQWNPFKGKIKIYKLSYICDYSLSSLIL
jgi:hypothetical protein